MPERRLIGMYMPDPAVRHAYEDLVRVLPAGAEATEPDETGIFEVSLEASDQDDALLQIWNAIAAAGVDDHIFLAEHPDLPGHWRARSRRPSR